MTTKTKTRGGRAPRRRREAGEAREAILDAAEGSLAKNGPDGIRLQEVAANAGVSHPTVLHHFGSRDGLVKALVARTLLRIDTRLVEALAASSGDEPPIGALLESVHEALEANGYGRVLLWLALVGDGLDRGAGNLSGVVDAAHALRKSRHRGKAPPREDTAHTVVLAALALVGFVALGPALLEKVGLRGDAATGRRFRSWFARQLRAHLEKTGPV